MKIGVRVAHTFSTAKYGSLRPELYVEDDVEEGETSDACYKRVTSIAHQLWAQEMKTHVSEHIAARTKIDRALG